MFVTYTFSFVLLCCCQTLVPLDLAVLPSTGTVLSRLTQPCELAPSVGWIHRLPWFVLWKALAARYLNVTLQSKAGKGGVPGSSPWNMTANTSKWQF